ncbi:hypothetical protein AeMF1_014962, partial [Aphanomyces euteiches]
SQSTETISLDHLSLEDDAIGIKFYKTKTKQEGTTIRDPRHCFANPQKPEANPTDLFTGSKQKDRFGKSLARLLVNLDESKGLGALAKREIGTHSIRKGVATFACSGTTGNVMERYFRYESAGDQFLGRVVAGLPVNSADFALLPPHFSNPDTPEVVSMVRLMFPHLCKISHLFGVLRLVLASLVYHHEFLLSKLTSTHALLQTPLLSTYGVVERLSSELVEIDDSKILRASGIPPHIYVYKKLDKAQKSISAIPDVILAGVNKIFEERGATAPHVPKTF